MERLTNIDDGAPPTVLALGVIVVRTPACVIEVHAPGDGFTAARNTCCVSGSTPIPSHEVSAPALRTTGVDTVVPVIEDFQTFPVPQVQK